jgi:hypothetical protein
MLRLLSRHAKLWITLLSLIGTSAFGLKINSSIRLEALLKPAWPLLCLTQLEKSGVSSVL